MGSEHIIKKIAWDIFKNTGDINTFLELKQIENIEKDIENNIKNNIEENVVINNDFENNTNKEKDIEKNGESEDKWNNTF